MDEYLRQLIEENNRLLQENLALTREHTKKIERINRYIRRTILWKILYWGVFVILTVSAYYYSRPFINEAVDSYNSLEEKVSETSDFVKNPNHLIQKLLNS